MAGGTFGLGTLGYNLKRTPDFQAQLESDIQAAFPGANVSAQSVFGQLIGVLSAVLAEREEQNFLMYNNLQLATAEGVSLDNLGLIMGLARNTDESDADYRNRLLSISLLNGTPENSTSNLCVALQAISGVQYVSVNTGVGSYEVVILGGDDQTIAETIYAYHPTGTTITGNTSFNVTSGCGFCQQISFTRPTEVPVCIRLEVTPLPDPCDCDTSSVTPFADAVFNQLTDSGEKCNSPLGVSLHAEQFYAALLSVGQVRITDAQFSRDGGMTYAAGPLVLAADEYASYDAACIEVSFQ